MEKQIIIQYLPCITCWDYLNIIFTGTITINGLEQLGNIQISKKKKKPSYVKDELYSLSFNGHKPINIIQVAPIL